MPVYIVRWPEPVVSLVSARDEEELKYRLDEAADPGSCTWQIYKGPIWVDFELPVEVDVAPREDKRRPLSPADVKVDISELTREPWQLVPTDSLGADTAHEMYERIRRFAFPALQCTLDGAPGGDPDAIDLEALKAAVAEDMQPLLEYAWRQAQLEARNDPEAELMKRLGVTVKVGALEDQESNDDDWNGKPDDE